MDNSALVYAATLARDNNQLFLPTAGLETDLIVDPVTSYEMGSFYQYGFISALIPLVKNYDHHGAHMSVFYEPVISFLQKIYSQHKITDLVSHEEHGTDGTYTRDKQVQSFCDDHGITWHQVPPSGVIRRLKSRDNRDRLVKTYLNNKVLKVPDFTQIKTIKYQDNEQTLSKFAEIQAKIAKNSDLQPTSEKAAHECLTSFTKVRAAMYRGGISSPNTALEYGSRLSQYLAFGSISLCYVTQSFWHNIKQTDNSRLKSGMLGAMKRLHWREHFIQRLEDAPNMPDVAIHPDFDKISYNNKYLDQYIKGETGEPLVDACIRCLNKTGFINFRMRALLISYAVFGLDLNWRDVGRYLATVFLDYEPGIHWSQVQMQAGVTGINTIRVYSPHKQLLDQDPNCIFVKQWIPELRNMPIEQILDYPSSGLYELTQHAYPAPIVDFKQTSKQLKAKTFGVRAKATKESSKNVYIKHGSRKSRPKKVNMKKVLTLSL